MSAKTATPTHSSSESTRVTSLYESARSPVHEQKASDSPGGSSNHPIILQRLPKKERDLLEDVVNRFRALDFNFDIKPFRSIRYTSQHVSAERQNGLAEAEASNSTNDAVTSTATPSHAAGSVVQLASDTPPDDPDTEDHPSTAYLARRIQTLLGSLPPPTSSDSPEEYFSTSSPLLSSIATPPNSPLFTSIPTLPSSPVSPQRQAVLVPKSWSQSHSPLPPSSTTHAENTDLMEMLSSATIMNGSSSHGKRTSIWSVLEDLRAPRGWIRSHNRTLPGVQGVVNDAPENIGRLGQVVEAEDEGSVFSDESSVMMYSPLMPTTSSLVELAETEFMPMSMSIGDEDQASQAGVGGSASGMCDAGSADPERARGAITEQDTPTQTRPGTHTSLPAPAPAPSSSSGPQESGPTGSWMRVWLFNAWGSKAEDPEAVRTVDFGATPKETATTDSPPDVQPIAGPSSIPVSSITSNDRSAVGVDPPQADNHFPARDHTPGATPLSVDPTTPRQPRFRVQGQRRWVPSTTKLSFETRWWGYRIYLPPPVLSILSDRQLEATKRAALITTALTWFFSNIPIDVLPPAARPGVVLLKTLIPCVGYIGTFISWSWATVMGYDEGYGVILTATWLLPVALIPGTWNQRDFPPASPGPQGPQTLPFVVPGMGMDAGPGGRDSLEVAPSLTDSSTISVSSIPESVRDSTTIFPSPHSAGPSLSSPLPPLPLPTEPAPSESPNAEHFRPPSSNLPRPGPLPLAFFSPPLSPTHAISPSSHIPSEPLPPSAPIQRTIPLPDHSSVLYESRSRPLPDLPSDVVDEEPYLQPFDSVPSPPPAPSPRTIPLPDVGAWHRSAKRSKGKEWAKFDEKEREPERKLWRLGSKRGSEKESMEGKDVVPR